MLITKIICYPAFIVGCFITINNVISSYRDFRIKETEQLGSALHSCSYSYVMPSYTLTQPTYK